MSLLRIGDISRLVGDEFRLEHADGQKILQLAEAKALSGGDETPDNATRGRPGGPFSLVFEGAASEAFQQGSHKIEHETLGAIDVFLVPVGQSGDKITYEAIFN